LEFNFSFLASFSHYFPFFLSLFEAFSGISLEKHKTTQTERGASDLINVIKKLAGEMFRDIKSSTDSKE